MPGEITAIITITTIIFLLVASEIEHFSWQYVWPGNICLYAPVVFDPEMVKLLGLEPNLSSL